MPETPDQPERLAASRRPRAFECYRCRHRFESEVLQETRARVPRGKPAAVLQSSLGGVARAQVKCPRCGSYTVHATLPHTDPANQR